MTEACDITNRPPPPEGNPAEDVIRKIISESKYIAIIGLSGKPEKESRGVGLYLKNHGYNVIPVNPNLEKWEGLRAYKSLDEVEGPVDVVDIFRKPETIGGLVDEIIRKKPKYAWFQLGIVNNEAAARLREAGVTVVQDRCMKIEHAAVSGK